MWLPIRNMQGGGSGSGLRSCCCALAPNCLKSGKDSSNQKGRSDPKRAEVFSAQGQQRLAIDAVVPHSADELGYS
eukprot:CAMPEP_0170650738 /NCGR_PEP_ID=MMETSP0224-20130122/45975_1 /TAXON_ID=285029 /ORGANISM="Togula jolla, Strain CCCM 725" /LENGTH=74 /DNA_ID=CAMNT_0010982445 /DNA_START=19 /DNA_END=243 /DNA_ORIENTATION=-